MASDPGLFIGSSSSSSVRVAPYQKENTFHSPSHFSLSLAYEYFYHCLGSFLCAQHNLLTIPWFKVHHVSHKRVSVSTVGLRSYER